MQCRLAIGHFWVLSTVRYLATPSEKKCCSREACLELNLEWIKRREFSKKMMLKKIYEASDLIEKFMYKLPDMVFKLLYLTTKAHERSDDLTKMNAS